MRNPYEYILNEEDGEEDGNHINENRKARPHTRPSLRPEDLGRLHAKVDSSMLRLKEAMGRLERAHNALFDLPDLSVPGKGRPSKSDAMEAQKRINAFSAAWNEVRLHSEGLGPNALDMYAIWGGLAG